jgi:hypothetical protein
MAFWLLALSDSAAAQQPTPAATVDGKVIALDEVDRLSALAWRRWRSRFFNCAGNGWMR